MGAAEGKIVDVIRDPIEDAKMRKVFEMFDKDKSGGLDMEEWKLFGKYLWLADIKEATEDVKKEVHNEFKTKAPLMAGQMGTAAASATGMLAKDVQPTHVDAWVEKMFKKADSDHSGSLSYDEFKRFLEDENQKEAEAHKVKVRDAVAKNMEQNKGGLRVSRQEGEVNKSVAVTVPGVNPNDIRNSRK